ncbi:hypothetical protein Q604_UNBC01052G0001, partial [human gut metagenome]
FQAEDGIRDPDFQNLGLKTRGGN